VDFTVVDFPSVASVAKSEKMKIATKTAASPTSLNSEAQMLQEKL
jgi:hypothetical protein